MNDQQAETLSHEFCSRLFADENIPLISAPELEKHDYPDLDPPSPVAPLVKAQERGRKFLAIRVYHTTDDPEELSGPAWVLMYQRYSDNETLWVCRCPDDFSAQLVINGIYPNPENIQRLLNEEELESTNYMDHATSLRWDRGW